MVQLLYKGALRVQDIVGPTFKDILKNGLDEQGCTTVHFDAKKSTERLVVFDKTVIGAVYAYQQHAKADDDDAMFPPASGDDPARNHARWIQRFFANKGVDVQSHDFRTTQATNYYHKSKDVVATQQFLGHSSVKSTERYIKPNQN